MPVFAGSGQCDNVVASIILHAFHRHFFIKREYRAFNSRCLQEDLDCVTLSTLPEIPVAIFQCLFKDHRVNGTRYGVADKCNATSDNSMIFSESINSQMANLADNITEDLASACSQVTCHSRSSW
eukprot:506919-Hanusia_phi.AAC.1